MQKVTVKAFEINTQQLANLAKALLVQETVISKCQTHTLYPARLNTLNQLHNKGSKHGIQLKVGRHIE